MSNYKIDVNLNYNTSGSPQKVSVQELKEQVQQAKELEKQKEVKGITSIKGKEQQSIDDKQLRMLNDQLNLTKHLIRTLTLLNKNLGKLEPSLKRPLIESEFTSTTRNLGKNVFQKNLGQELLNKVANLVSSISIMGIPIGAVFGAIGQGVSYAWDKISNIGNAYIQKALQQATTAGIAGFQSAGAGSYFASDIGAFVKERKMALGKFKTDEGEFLKLRPDTENPFVIKYSQLFGTSPQEIGRLIGLLDRMTNLQGEQSFAKILGYTSSANIQSETQILLSGLQSVLEEAVEEGVNNSNLAIDLAKEISIISKNNQNLSIKALLDTQKSLLDLQKAVSSGQVQTLSQLKTYEITKDIVKKELTKGNESELFRTFISAGILSPDEIEKFRTKGIDFQTLDTLTRVALQQRNPEITKNVLLSFYKQFGTGETTEEKIRNTLFSMTALGLNDIPLIQNPTLFAKYMKGIIEGSQDIANLSETELKQNAEMLFKAKIKTQSGLQEIDLTQQEPFRILSLQVEQEMLNLGEVGKKSADAIMNLNKETLNMANNLVDIVIPAVKAMDNTFTLAAQNANKLIVKLKELQEKWGFKDKNQGNNNSSLQTADIVTP